MNIVEALPYFLLMFVRLTSFFLVAPIFSMKGVPNQYKIGFSFFIALIALSTQTVEDPILFDVYYILLVLKEVIIGLSLGFTAALLLYTVQVAGSFIDFQMGFAIANVMDPQTGAQVPIIGHFKYMLSLLFLLTVDGHHLILDGVMRSFQLVPIDMVSFSISSGDIAHFMTTMFIQMFLIAIQIALPIVGSLFLVDFALGILAKTVPQLNIFVVGLPLKIIVGFILLFLLMPIFFYVLQTLFEKILISMNQLIRLLGG